MCNLIGIPSLNHWVWSIFPLPGGLWEVSYIHYCSYTHTCYDACPPNPKGILFHKVHVQKLTVGHWLRDKVVSEVLIMPEDVEFSLRAHPIEMDALQAGREQN